MRPLLHPALVNGRFGDPVVYVETLFERDAILLDLGDIGALPPRKLSRIAHVFVSHAHVDHFYGFDGLLRVLVGREKEVRLYGPQDFIGHVGHKLHAYQWNLASRYSSDLRFVVTEVADTGETRRARFRLHTRFRCEEVDPTRAAEGVIYSEPAYRVRAAHLEHRTPCLGFAIEEATHVNVWKNRLAARGLPVGPWLRELKHAIVNGFADDHRVRVGPRAGEGDHMALGELRDVVTMTSGQKIAYVTDVADSDANRQAIVQLARDADMLFIEAAFAEADVALAAERAHLTTSAAGRLAREAGARRVEPFHFSPRYEGEEARMLAEVAAAFEGRR